MKFKSNYILRVLAKDYNFLTPNILIIDEENRLVEFRRRNWYLISVNTRRIHFGKITGVSINKHLIGATITINSSGTDSIILKGFSKRSANRIQKIIMKNI